MLNIKAKKVLRGCVIAVIGAIISFAVTAALKNHFNNGGMFKFAAKPGGEIGLADKATPSAQSVGGSAEIFLLPSGAGFDHLEPFECFSNSSKSYRDMLARMNKWMGQNPNFEKVGIYTIDSHGGILKFAMACKKAKVVDLKWADKKKN